MAGFFKDVVDFKLWEGKKVLSDIGKKPSRMLTGVDPWSTNVWNTVKGSDDKPIVDQMGGTTKANMSQMDREGMNTSPGRRMEDIAHVVAAIFGAKGLAGIGGGSSAGGAAIGEGAAAGGGGMGIGQIGVSEMTPALMESAVGTGGYGFSSASAGYGAAGAGGMSNAGRYMQMGGNAAQQQQDAQEKPLDQDEVELPEDTPAYWRMPHGAMATSSRRAKRPVNGARMQSQVIEAGASGADPISQNGVHISAIQALTKRYEDAAKRLAKLNQERGHHVAIR